VWPRSQAWGRSVDSSGTVARITAAIVCVVAVVWLSLWYFIPAPPSTVTLAIGIKGTPFEDIALRYRERLASHRVALVLRPTGGMLENLKLVNDPASGVDAAFLFGGLATSGQARNVISLGRIDYAPMGIFYRGPDTVDRLTQLKGKRIALGPARALVAGDILGAYGVNEENSKFVPVVGPGAAKALKDGQVDAAFLPIELNFPVVQSLLRDPEIKLVDFAEADTLARLFPSLSRLVLLKGMVDLEKNIPATDVNLVATANAVVVRKDLHPELIYLLAQSLQEEHSGAGAFHRAGEFPTQTDPEFPMAAEAVDYYKNGPSFLQRYLPFLMINYAKRVAAIVVAAVAIVIPLFTFTPKLYAWLLNLRLARLYRRLRLVNAQLKRELTAEQVAALQNDLDHIDHAANVLPMRHSDLFFSLLMHIDMTRTRLTARSAALQRLNSAA